jgi:hypothetical protein
LYLAHLIRLDWMTITIIGKECKLWRSSSSNFLHPAVTSSLFGPNLFLSTLFWTTSTCDLPLMVIIMSMRWDCVSELRKQGACCSSLRLYEHGDLCWNDIDKGTLIRPPELSGNHTSRVIK